MNESGMTLLREWAGEDPRGWWLSEKLNGCRGFFDGAHLWTRGGNVIDLPQVSATLPPGVPLDGEVWAGRDGFTVARLAVQYGHFRPGVRFVAFDAPQAPGGWRERLAYATTLTATVEPIRCEGRRHLRAELRRIQAEGGEGLVIRADDAAPYQVGRSTAALKVLHPSLRFGGQ